MDLRVLRQRAVPGYCLLALLLWACDCDDSPSDTGGGVHAETPPPAEGTAASLPCPPDPELTRSPGYVCFDDNHRVVITQAHSTDEFIYDDAANLIESSMQEDGRVVWLERLTYDAQNREVGRESFGDNETTPYMTETRTYEGDQVIVRTVSAQGRQQLRTITRGSDGRRLRVAHDEGADGQVDQLEHFRYEGNRTVIEHDADADGHTDQIDTETETAEGTIREYDYDADGAVDARYLLGGGYDLEVALPACLERQVERACFRLCVAPSQLDEATKLDTCAQGCLSGCGDCCLDLSVAVYGRGQPRFDRERATEVFQQGCTLEVGGACYALGRLLEEDASTENAEQVQALQARACELGFHRACSP